MPGKLDIFMGLPGSGKSTIAAERKAASDREMIIVNRDDIRTELFGEDYHNNTPDRKSEQKVSRIQESRISDGLKNDNLVISDDTNLNTLTIDNLVNIAEKNNAEFEIVPVNVSLATALERNKKRGEAGGRFVPEFAIRTMYQNSYNPVTGELNSVKRVKGTFQFEHEFSGEKLTEMYSNILRWKNPINQRGIVVVDIDGTLANNGHMASRFLNHPKKPRDFEGFFKGIKNAPVNYEVRDLANRMREQDGLGIVILTGRSISFAEELIHFVERSKIKASRLIANNSQDRDDVFKAREVAKLRQEGFVIVAAIDDRPQSIKMWEDHGIHVEKVNHYDLPYDYATMGNKPFDQPAVESIYGTGVCLRCGQPLSDKTMNIGPVCATKV